MDCKDLMLGDWVRCNDLKRQVAAIGETVGFLDCNNQVYWAYEGFDRIDPIPLTEEILVKNGFDKDERSKYFHVYTLNIKGSYDFDICWSSVNGFNYEGDFMLTYVHQLQHLLRLCGIEKELVID